MTDTGSESGVISINTAFFFPDSAEGSANVHRNCEKKEWEFTFVAERVIIPLYVVFCNRTEGRGSI